MKFAGVRWGNKTEKKFGICCDGKMSWAFLGNSGSTTTKSLLKTNTPVYRNKLLLREHFLFFQA